MTRRKLNGTKHEKVKDKIRKNKGNYPYTEINMNEKQKQDLITFLTTAEGETMHTYMYTKSEREILAYVENLMKKE